MRFGKSVKSVSALTLTGLLLLTAMTSLAQPDVVVVMRGLDNPRGLAIGPEGGLYVAEAGRGGTGPCTVLRGASQCYGPTGALTRLWGGNQERVATGLPSQINPATLEVIGPHDVSLHERGGAYVTVGFGGNPALRLNFGPDGAVFGRLVHVPAGGHWRVIADIAAYESAANPVAGPIDSNPFGIIAEPAGRVATDAGGNSLLHIAANGKISTLATFPSRPARTTDAVPTGLTVGPDGSYYVGELTGGPFAAGAARVYRVVPGTAPQIVLEGFKTIMDIAFGPDGSLFVVEFASGPVFFPGPGRLLRVFPDGTRHVVLENLDRPTSVVVDPDDGAVYVTNRGQSIGNGEVLRIEP